MSTSTPHQIRGRAHGASAYAWIGSWTDQIDVVIVVVETLAVPALEFRRDAVVLGAGRRSLLRSRGGGLQRCGRGGLARCASRTRRSRSAPTAVLVQQAVEFIIVHLVAGAHARVRVGLRGADTRLQRRSIGIEDLRCVRGQLRLLRFLSRGGHAALLALLGAVLVPVDVPAVAHVVERLFDRGVAAQFFHAAHQHGEGHLRPQCERPLLVHAHDLREGLGLVRRARLPFQKVELIVDLLQAVWTQERVGVEYFALLADLLANCTAR